MYKHINKYITPSAFMFIILLWRRRRNILPRLMIITGNNPNIVITHNQSWDLRDKPALLKQNMGENRGDNS